MTYGRNGRTDMQRSGQRTLTLDDTAQASHPGKLRVSLWRWAGRYPKWPAILVGASILTPILITTVSKLWLIALPLSVIPLIWYRYRIQEHFRYGDANPGMVVSTEPLLIAVLTDMTKGEGSYPMLHVREEKDSPSWGVPIEVGKRVATVGLYEVGEDEKTPHWGEFDPRAVEPLAADAEEAQGLLKSFSDEQWASLESAVRDLKPDAEGLFPIEA